MSRRSDDQHSKTRRSPYNDAYHNSSIGYGRPPEATQFRPGISGNPRGRPKSNRHVLEIISDVFGGKITVRTGGKTQRMSRLEALLKKQMELALQGEPRALTETLKIGRDFGFLKPTDLRDLTVLSDEELHQLRDLLIKAAGHSSWVDKKPED